MISNAAALSSIALLVGGLLFSPASSSSSCADDGYSMYVWTSGFNPAASYCAGVYPANKVGDNANCFTHNWDTPAARSKLWASCSQPGGREVTRIFLSDVKSRIADGGYVVDAASPGTCDAALTTLLSEAHGLGIRVYALFSASDAAFSESTMASYPKQFNDVCGNSVDVYFDGVAVNNEHFANIRSCNAEGINDLYVADQQDHLDRLQLTADNAFPLPLHFSVSWNWDCCSCSSTDYKTRDLAWGGTTKSVVAHMVDIVDSVDVQVAFIKNSTMERRTNPVYQYWNAKVSKADTSKVYALSYTNPTDLCQTSYSPHIEGSTTVQDTCSFSTINPRTEEGMHMGFDHVESALDGVKGSIHFMNGVYGSGITEGWPIHAMPADPPSCSNSLPGQCSDGTGQCSETDLDGCACNTIFRRSNRRLEGELREGGQLLLRGSEMPRRPEKRNLKKTNKTPAPTQSPMMQTPQPTDNPTAFECKCVLPTPAPTSPPTGGCTPDEGGCTDDGQCCSGNCHTGGGFYADKCKP